MSTISGKQALLPGEIDVDYLWHTFASFVAFDTSARMGENGIPPADPRLAAFARDGARPAFEELGAAVGIDDHNNVTARFGAGTGRELLFLGYPALHHGNLMLDPLHARRRTAGGTELWVGLGASQSKAGLAACCAAVRALRERGVQLDGRVVLGACSEGMSSHASSKRLYEGLVGLPAGAILLIGTDNRLALGNRGRVDIVVTIRGVATHSSAPQLGSNPIPAVADVLERLAGIHLARPAHPLLGAPTLTPYKLVCGPVAPHTIPSECTLIVDRRLLPGERPEEASAEIAARLATLPVEVEQGPAMLPALVGAKEAVVVALQTAASAVSERLEAYYPPFTFDAGYGCSIGVPTVMCGPSSGDIAGAGVLAEDFVSKEQVLQAATLYANAMLVATD